MKKEALAVRRDFPHQLVEKNSDLALIQRLFEQAKDSRRRTARRIQRKTAMKWTAQIPKKWKLTAGVRKREIKKGGFSR